MHSDGPFQVARSRPYKAAHGSVETAWKEIAENLNQHPQLLFRELVTAAGVKNKYYRLVKQFRSEEAESLKASGSDEDYDELCQLLTDTVQDEDDHEEATTHVKQERDKKKQQLLDDGKYLREASLAGLTTTTKRPSAPGNAMQSTNASRVGEATQGATPMGKMKVPTARSDDSTSSILSGISTFLDGRKESIAEKTQFEVIHFFPHVNYLHEVHLMIIYS